MTTDREPDPPAPPPPAAPHTLTARPLRGRAAQLRAFAEARPFLATFLVLAPAMSAILLWSMQSVPLLPQQRLLMVIATVGLAAACAWIITLD